MVEEGKLYKYIQLFLVLAAALGILISGIDLSEREVTKIYENSEAKQYHVKKVSHIPKEKEKEEAEKIAVEDDKLSEDELKDRYYAYVVSRIEGNKIYPESEQKKGHEGSIVLKIYINRNGTVEKVKILRQARYIKLTKAAVGAIQKSIPLKSYSKEISDDMLILKLEIAFNLQ